MYACICNDISGEKLLKAISSGITTSEGILAYYEASFLCGLCREHIEERILESNKK